MYKRKTEKDIITNDHFDDYFGVYIKMQLMKTTQNIISLYLNRYYPFTLMLQHIYKQFFSTLKINKNKYYNNTNILYGNLKLGFALALDIRRFIDSFYR